MEEEYPSRETRSSPNAVIKRNVQPQTKVRVSVVEGRRVKIIDGPYSGMTGRIESCIPGNWYLVSELSKKNKFDLNYIIHAKSLEILAVESKDTKRKQNESSIKRDRNQNFDSNCTVSVM